MLSHSEDEMIEKIIRHNGMTEENCLAGLTDQQIRVWVRYAILMEPIDEIMVGLFGHRKNINESTVRYVLADAALRITANVLEDADIMYEAQQRPRLRKRVQNLIDNVAELRKKKGAKILCRKSRKTN